MCSLRTHCHGSFLNLMLLLAGVAMVKSGCCVELGFKKSFLQCAPRLLLFSGLALSACGTSPQTSETKYAHYESMQLLGSPIARLEAMKMGYEVDFSSLDVCVENGRSDLTDQEALAEVKLVYAMWLKESGSYDENAWRKLSFANKSKCNPEDNSNSAVVIFSDGTSGGQDISKFNEPKISCERRNGSVSCKGTSLIMGFGGPGWITPYYYSPEKWIRLAKKAPSTTVFSPYVQWTSLKKDVMRSEDISDSVKNKVTREYDSLVADQSPAKLFAFAKLLEDQKILIGKDAGFQTAFQRFFDGTADEEETSFTPNVGVFHVLLHEVGHQFGMGHADNPQPDDVTGYAAGNEASASRNANGQWVTDKASMAYALTYTYLTADDKAGIKSVGKTIRDQLTNKK